MFRRLLAWNAATCMKFLVKPPWTPCLRQAEASRAGPARLEVISDRDAGAAVNMAACRSRVDRAADAIFAGKRWEF